MDEQAALLRDDPAVDLSLDGNAVAGLLAAVFATEVTEVPGRCAHCGTVSLVGTLRAYTRGPGIVLRCPACAGVVLRIVETPSATLVDLTGIRSLRLPRA